MGWIFLPLVMVFFKWREFSRFDWFFTVSFVAYSVDLTFLSELPLNSYLGSFYVGIPSISYFLFLFPNIQTHYPDDVVKVMSLVGFLISFVCLLLFF